MSLNIVRCVRCDSDFEFEDDGESAACMPDGLLTGDGQWICSDCLFEEEEDKGE